MRRSPHIADGSAGARHAAGAGGAAPAAGAAARWPEPTPGGRRADRNTPGRGSWPRRSRRWRPRTGSGREGRARSAGHRRRRSDRARETPGAPRRRVDVGAQGAMRSPSSTRPRTAKSYADALARYEQIPVDSVYKRRAQARATKRRGRCWWPSTWPPPSRRGRQGAAPTCAPRRPPSRGWIRRTLVGREMVRHCRPARPEPVPAPVVAAAPGRAPAPAPRASRVAAASPRRARRACASAPRPPPEEVADPTR